MTGGFEASASSPTLTNETCEPTASASGDTASPSVHVSSRPSKATCTTLEPATAPRSSSMVTTHRSRGALVGAAVTIPPERPPVEHAATQSTSSTSPDRRRCTSTPFTRERTSLVADLAVAWSHGVARPLRSCHSPARATMPSRVRHGSSGTDPVGMARSGWAVGALARRVLERQSGHSARLGRPGRQPRTNHLEIRDHWHPRHRAPVPGCQPRLTGAGQPDVVAPRSGHPEAGAPRQKPPLPWAWSQRRSSPSSIWPAPTPSSAANGPQRCGVIHTWIIGAGRNFCSPARQLP